MSWDDFVINNIINYTETSGECVYSICRRGAIVSTEGAMFGACNFEFLTYQHEQEDNDGNPVSFIVNEWESFLKCWENEGRDLLQGGLRMNNEKFVVSKFDKDLETMYCTGTSMGACIAKSDTTFCIGVYYKTPEPLETSLGNTRNYSAGNANGAVEKCRDKMREEGL